MIASLTGTLIYRDTGSAVVECGGVGFKCAVSLNTLRALPDIGKTVTLHTHLAVRDDALDLYGFAEPAELECFKTVIGVNGVGGKVALSLLSEFTPDRIALLVAAGDAKSLTRAAGVGNKLAQRLVLELKDKWVGRTAGTESTAAAAAAVSASSTASEAVAALTALGWSQSEAAVAVAGLDPALPVEELIRGGLKVLAGKTGKSG